MDVDRAFKIHFKDNTFILLFELTMYVVNEHYDHTEIVIRIF